MSTSQPLEGERVKALTFRNFRQIEVEARELLSIDRPFVPVGYPFEGIEWNEPVVCIRFEQREVPLSETEIDARIQSLISVLQKIV